MDYKQRNRIPAEDAKYQKQWKEIKSTPPMHITQSGSPM